MQLIISDLHLSGERPALAELFLRLLTGPAREAEALYILGDLFEYWLGDDMVPPEAAPLLDALAALSAAGTAVRIQHGNRDFLIGKRLCARTGAELLPEPYCTELGGRPAVLLHGDSLCTDDTAYQAMRRQIRDPAFVHDFLSKPPEERIAMARGLREKSREEVGRKEYAIMDVNAEAVEQAFRQLEVELMVHGHTHRPGVHELTVDGRPVQRLVLGDWSDRGARIAVCDDSGCRLMDFGG